jgi:hypothetical protein
MSPTIILIFDVVIAGLLIATIVYAIMLNRQLVNLRESRGEMEALIRSFGEATARAESGIKAMKRTAADTGEGLQKSIEKAASLRDELHFLVEAGESLAQRLADAPGAARPSGTAKAAPARRPLPEPRRLPDLEDVSQDLPRGRGVLTRAGLERLEQQARGDSRRPTPNDDGPDLPRGRTLATRAAQDRSDRSDRPERPEREREPAGKPDAETDGDRGAPQARGEESRPVRREGGDGLSRAERELLQAMESRR